MTMGETMQKKLLLATMVAAALAAGCGDDGAVGNRAGLLIDDICDAVFRCCDRGEVSYYFGDFTDEDNCRERLQNSAELAALAAIGIPLENIRIYLPNLPVLQAAVDDGRAEFNAANVKACRELIQSAECAVEPEEPPVGCVPVEIPEESPCDLENLVIGKVERGHVCTSPGTSFECKEGLTCVRYNSLGLDGVCVEPGDVGEYCYSDGECNEELYCSFQDGTCQVPAGEGETCAFADPLDPTPSPFTQIIKCAEGLSCDPVSKTCVGGCKAGAICQRDENCDTEAGLTCIGNRQGLVTGRCDVLHEDGQPCDAPNGNDDCAAGLRCDVDPRDPTQDICQPKFIDAASCVGYTNDDCASGFCNGSVCVPALAAGDVCLTQSDLECAAGFCDNSEVAINCSANPGLCSNSCNGATCNPFCSALLPNDSACIRDSQCVSGGCVNNLCKPVPLANGASCNNSLQCESGFCNVYEVAPTCVTLPLANGAACVSGSVCDSKVCFGGVCTTGAGLGTDCGGMLEPCAKDFYCDTKLSRPSCAAKLSPGDACDTSEQCYGGCQLRYNQQVCDPTPPEGALTCDGI